MLALFFVWLGLFITGLTTSAVEAIRPFLPLWFPTLNLLVLPVLTLFTAASLPIRPEIRLIAGTLALCSMSALYLSYHTHPLGYFIALAALLVEAYIVVPRWNRHRRRLQPSPPGRASVPLISRMFDYVVYVGVGLAVAFCIVYVILSRK